MSSKCVRTVIYEADGTLVGPLRSPRQRLPNRSMTIAFRPMTIQPRKIKTQGHFVVHEAHEEQSFARGFLLPGDRTSRGFAFAVGRRLHDHCRARALSDRDRAVLSELRRQSNGGEREK